MPPAIGIHCKHPPGGLRELLAVALPLVVSSGSWSLMYVVDRILLTHSSIDALAAAMPSGLLHWTLLSLPMGIAAYANTFVAQYEGAGRKDRVAAALWQAIHFSLLAGMAILAAVPWAPRLFEWLARDPDVRRLEIDYFKILCLGSWPTILAMALSCFYSGRGRTWTVMWVNLAGALTNIVLDYLLIFGCGPVPALGIEGAAIGHVLANTVTAVLYVGALLGDAEARGYGLGSAWRLDRELFQRLLRFGMPSGLQLFADIFCFTLFIQLVGQLGKEQLAATNLAFNLNSLIFVPVLGFGTAVMTLTGQRIGEGRPALAVRTTWLAFGIGGGYTLLFALVYLAIPDLLLLPYMSRANAADFAAVRHHVVLLLRFVSVYAIFDCMTIVFGGAIRGAGDTLFALLYLTATSFLLMVVPTYVAHYYWHAGLLAAWTSATAFIVALGLGFLLRFQGGRWKTMRVIEQEASADVAAPAAVESPAAVEWCAEEA